MEMSVRKRGIYIYWGMEKERKKEEIRRREYEEVRE